MTTWVDEAGQERCDEIEDLSFEQLQCGGGLGGRHMFSGNIEQRTPGKTFPNSECVVEHCNCGRWRRRTFSKKTNEVLSVAYGGGVILTGPFKARDVWVAYIRACFERQRKALKAVR